MQKTNAIRLLEQLKIQYNTAEYSYDDENLSVEKIAEDNQLELSSIYKTLVCLTNTNEIVVAVVAGDAQLTNKKLAAAAGVKKIDLAPMKDLQALTGYIRGGCSPLGMKKQFAVFIDQSATTKAWIYVNAGRRGLLFGCAPQELARAAKATFVDLS